MQKFPKLKNKEIALLIADANTGHILDIELNLKISPSQTVYKIFNSVDEALTDIEIIKKARNHLEFIIYGIDKEVLKAL